MGEGEYGGLLLADTVRHDKLDAALRHNLRHLLPGHPGPVDGDPRRRHLNEVLAGADGADPIRDAARLAAEAMLAHGLALPTRANGVAAHELVFSLPPELPAPTGYFHSCVDWAAARTRAPVVSAVVHRDQGAEHCHTLLLPVVDGKWVGSRLLGKFADMQADFRAKVAAPFGFREAPRLTGARKAEAVAQVLAWMSTSPARECPSWPAIEATVKANPALYLAAIGLSRPSPSKPARDFASIMISTGKRTSEDAERRRSG